LEILTKSICVARTCAEESGIALQGLATAERLINDIMAQGCDNDGTQVLYRLSTHPDGSPS
jgi:3-hydroxyisobutyrate dehydrogenase-like beta-hydroxyacid dehydrogenase